MRLPIYSGRLDRVENYSVERLPDGWEIHKPGIGGSTIRQESPIYLRI